MKKKLLKFVAPLTILLIIFLVLENETKVRRLLQQETVHHASVLATPLWNLSKAQSKAYIDQAIRHNNHENISIFLTSGEKYLDVKNDHIVGFFDSFFDAIGLIPTYQARSEIMYKDDVIGHISIHAKVKTVYKNIYIIILGLLFIYAARQHLITLKDKENLDSEVIKRTEELATSESNYRGLFEQSPIGLALCSMDGSLVEINSSYANIIGYRFDEILKLSYWDITPEKYATEEKIQLEKLAKDGKYGPYEKEYLHKNGHLVPVRLNGMIFERKGEKLILSSVEDITVLKEAEDKAKNAYLKMDQMKTEFISTAAHELRTPLTAIMGFTEFLRSPEDFGEFSKEQYNEFLDEIYSRGEALNLIIDDLLDVSRIESGKGVELNLQEGSLVGLLNRVAATQRVNHSDHTLDLEVTIGDPDELCMFDKHRITQVLENLLSNAFKYSSKENKVLLSCFFDLNHWVVSVKDQGIGMTPEQVEQVFDKFYRANSSNTAVSGLGLGMTIAKQIVLAHGGEIEVESTEGLGTTVTLKLPRKLS